SQTAAADHSAPRLEHDQFAADVAYLDAVSDLERRIGLGSGFVVRRRREALEFRRRFRDEPLQVGARFRLRFQLIHQRRTVAPKLLDQVRDFGAQPLAFQLRALAGFFSALNNLLLDASEAGLALAQFFGLRIQLGALGVQSFQSV